MVPQREKKNLWPMRSSIRPCLIKAYSMSQNCVLKQQTWISSIHQTFLSLQSSVSWRPGFESRSSILFFSSAYRRQHWIFLQQQVVKVNGHFGCFVLFSLRRNCCFTFYQFSTNESKNNFGKKLFFRQYTGTIFLLLLRIFETTGILNHSHRRTTILQIQHLNWSNIRWKNMWLFVLWKIMFCLDILQTIFVHQ